MPTTTKATAANAVAQANGDATLMPGNASTTNASNGNTPTTAKATNVASSSSQRIRPHCREAVLARHHHVDPAPPIGRDRLGGGIEQFAGQAVASEQLADLLPLAGRHELDVPLLVPLDATPPPLLRADAEIVGHRHAEPVGDEVRRSEHEHDGCVEPSASDTGHDGVRGHRAVDRPVDHVAEVTRPGRLGEASRNRRRPVLGSEAPDR